MAGAVLRRPLFTGFGYNDSVVNWAKCNHMDHVTTQLPYAATVATASAVGYIVVGFTESGLAGFVTTAVVLVALVFIVKKR